VNLVLDLVPVSASAHLTPSHRAEAEPKPLVAETGLSREVHGSPTRLPLRTTQLFAACCARS
jgi:hypothetical protein